MSLISNYLTEHPEFASNFSIDKIRTQLFDALSAGTPEQVRERTDKILMSALVAGATFSAVNPGSDFLDFSVGLSLHQVLSPMINAMIVDPMKDALQKGFRFSGPGMRAMLPILEAGVIDDKLLRAGLIDAGLKDEYIEAFLDYAHYKMSQKRQALVDELYRKHDEQIFSRAALVVSRYESMSAKLQAHIDALEEQSLVAPMDNSLSMIVRLSERLDNMADKIEETLDEKAQEKLRVAAFVLYNRSQKLR